MSTLLPEDREAGLVSHLEELRTRILYIMVALVVGTVVGWAVYPSAYDLVAGPILRIVKAHGGMIFTLQPGEAFFTRCKLSLLIGLALASPIGIWQLWAFVRPGLTPHERKAVTPLVPAISLLFLAGAGLAYLMLPNIVTFFMGYVPQGVSPNIDFQNSINFPVKVMIAFGLAFQLPILLLGLVSLRVISPQMLLRQWRYAIVVLGLIAAIVTPTGDPFNWSMLMLPLLILYFGTILIAFWIQRPRKTGAGGKGS